MCALWVGRRDEDLTIDGGRVGFEAVRVKKVWIDGGGVVWCFSFSLRPRFKNEGDCYCCQ